MKELFEFMDIVKGNYLKDLGKVLGIIFIIQLCLEFNSMYIGKQMAIGSSFVSDIFTGVMVVFILNVARNEAIRKDGTFTRLMMLPSKYKHTMKIRYFYSEFLFCFIGVILWNAMWFLNDFVVLMINRQNSIYESNSLFYILLQSETINDVSIYQFSSPIMLMAMIFMLLSISVLCTLNPKSGISSLWIFLSIPLCFFSSMITEIIEKPLYCLIYNVISFIGFVLLSRFIYLRSDLK